MTGVESTAAINLRLEMTAAAELALIGSGVYCPRIVRAERVRPGVIEALYVVEQADGTIGARRAEIRTDAGQPKVLSERGWPVRLHRPV